MLAEDCPDRANSEYRLFATVVHHGRSIAGKRKEWPGGSLQHNMVLAYIYQKLVSTGVCCNRSHRMDCGWIGTYSSILEKHNVSEPHTILHPTGGHYTADVLQPDGRWLRFNDAVVDAVNEAAVLAERPYLLFYQRCAAPGTAGAAAGRSV